MAGQAKLKGNFCFEVKRVVLHNLMCHPVYTYDSDPNCPIFYLTDVGGCACHPLDPTSTQFHHRRHDDGVRCQGIVFPRRLDQMRSESVKIPMKLPQYCLLKRNVETNKDMETKTVARLREFRSAEPPRTSNPQSSQIQSQTLLVRLDRPIFVLDTS